MHKPLLFFFSLLLLTHNISTINAQEKPFSNVVIWGHKMNGHTHMWIHAAFYRAFAFLGYNVHWLSDADDISSLDLSNSLFITEGQADKNIPLREDSRYILHNCYSSKYDPLFDVGNIIKLDVYTHKCTDLNVKEIAPYTYIDRENKCIYMPWATDLLPHEVEFMKQVMRRTSKKNESHWIGTLYEGDKFSNLEKVKPFVTGLREHGITFCYERNISRQENIKRIQESIVAPAIVGEWQEKEGYIPCRIFKNISYGAMGVTNSKSAYELFNKKIIYNPDTYQLCHDALDHIKNMDIGELYELMDFVRDNHTYLNRIDSLFYFINVIKPLKNYQLTYPCFFSELKND